MATFEAQFAFIFLRRDPVFITQSNAEHAMPPSLTEPGEQYWRAVSLSIEAPWFLFIYDEEAAGIRMQQTVLIAWESDLVTFVESVPFESRLAIARVSIPTVDFFRWKLQWIDGVWVRNVDNEMSSEIFFRFEGEDFIRDVHLNKVEQRALGTLLFGRV